MSFAVGCRSYLGCPALPAISGNRGTDKILSPRAEDGYGRAFHALLTKLRRMYARMQRAAFPRQPRASSAPAGIQGPVVAGRLLPHGFRKWKGGVVRARGLETAAPSLQVEAISTTRTPSSSSRTTPSSKPSATAASGPSSEVVNLPTPPPPSPVVLFL